MAVAAFRENSDVLVEACLAQLRGEPKIGGRPPPPTIQVLDSIDIIEEEPRDPTMVVQDDELVIEAPSAVTQARPRRGERDERASDAKRRRQRTVVTKNKRSRGARPGSPAPARRTARWPMLFCALIATYAALCAVIQSPLGATPEVRAAVREAAIATRAALSSASAVTEVVSAVVDSAVEEIEERRGQEQKPR